MMKKCYIDVMKSSLVGFQKQNNKSHITTFLIYDFACLEILKKHKTLSFAQRKK